MQVITYMKISVSCSELALSFILMTIFVRLLYSLYEKVTNDHEFGKAINKHQRIAKGQSKMDNPEKMATQGTQDTG